MVKKVGYGTPPPPPKKEYELLDSIYELNNAILSTMYMRSKLLRASHVALPT